jgi:hypothetical protein
MDFAGSFSHSEGNLQPPVLGNRKALVGSVHQRLYDPTLTIGRILTCLRIYSTTARPFRQRRDGNKPVTFWKMTKAAPKNEPLND